MRINNAFFLFGMAALLGCFSPLALADHAERASPLDAMLNLSYDLKDSVKKCYGQDLTCYAIANKNREDKYRIRQLGPDAPTDSAQVLQTYVHLKREVDVGDRSVLVNVYAGHVTKGDGADVNGIRIRAAY